MKHSIILKCLVFDIDGTLTDNPDSISFRILNQVRALKKKGLVSILATGRNIDSFTNLSQKCNLENYFYKHVICSNGNCIYNQVDNNLEIVNPISPNVLIDIWKKQKNYADIAFLNGSELTYTSRTALLKYKLAFLASPISKRLINLDCNKEASNLNKITVIYVFPLGNKILKVDKKEDYNVRKLKKLNIYMISSKNTKLDGLRILLKNKTNIDITKNVMAFGDHFNDFELLKEASLSICMKNSPKEIIKISDYTLSIDELCDFLEDIQNRVYL